MPISEFCKFAGLAKDTRNKNTEKIIADMSYRLAVLSGFSTSVFKHRLETEVQYIDCLRNYLPKKIFVQIPIMPNHYCIDCFINDSLVGQAPYIRNEWIHLWALHCSKHGTALSPLGGSNKQIYSYRYLPQNKKPGDVKYWDQNLILEKPVGFWRPGHFARKISVDLSLLMMGKNPTSTSYFYKSPYNNTECIRDAVYALIYILGYGNGENSIGDTLYRQGFHDIFDCAIFKRNMYLFEDLSRPNPLSLLSMPQADKGDVLHIVGLFLMKHKLRSRAFDRIIYTNFQRAGYSEEDENRFVKTMKQNPLIFLCYLAYKVHKINLAKEVKRYFPNFYPFWKIALNELSEIKV